MAWAAVVGSATIKVLAGALTKTIKSLVVTEARGTLKALKELYADRLVCQADYTSSFDISWP